jgi:dGTP triphosphohydrolase
VLYLAAFALPGREKTGPWGAQLVGELCDYAAKRGERDLFVEKDGRTGYRSVYKHDLDKITWSPPFRRTAHKQYAIGPPGPENRTRLLHSLEVGTIAIGMAERLGLTIQLTQAIAFGHDVGQPSFGHPSIQAIRDFEHRWSEAHGDPGHRSTLFSHELFGYQLLQWHSMKTYTGKTAYRGLHEKPEYKLVPAGGFRKITTISFEALDGIRNHTRECCSRPATVEAQLVQMADNLSYLSQEVDEAFRLGEDLRETYQGYATRDTFVLQNGKCKTRDQLRKATQHLAADENFLDCVFNSQVGPRLSTMIHRIETYNAIRIADGDYKSKKSTVADNVVPTLEYDPNLAHIIDFIWDEFIRKHVHRNEIVAHAYESHYCRITKLLNALASDNVLLQHFGDEHAFMTEMVDHYFKKERDEVKQRTTICYFVAYLTDGQIDELLEKVQ